MVCTPLTAMRRYAGSHANLIVSQWQTNIRQLSQIQTQDEITLLYKQLEPQPPPFPLWRNEADPSLLTRTLRTSLLHVPIPNLRLLKVLESSLRTIRKHQDHYVAGLAPEEQNWTILDKMMPFQKQRHGQRQTTLEESPKMPWNGTRKTTC
jgi:hypothetical protein